MKILFYFGHPAQYLFLKNSINLLKQDGVFCDLIIKSKDILEKLLIENHEIYTNILPEGRNTGKLGIALGLLKRDVRLFQWVDGKKYDLFVGTDPSLSHIGYIKRIPVLTVLEDDIYIIPRLAKIKFPFTSLIVTPSSCNTGKFERKTIHYNGYMKLAYLHPNRFSISESSLKKPYFLIRRSKLEAHHDNNIRGMTDSIINRIFERLKGIGEIYISTEGVPNNMFRDYELRIEPSKIHQVLANSKLLISDSQSMSMEASMLGIPSIRFSDFAGRIGVLEELEHKYNLTFGIHTNNPDALFDKIEELLNISNLEEEFQRRRRRMLDDKIDVTSFMVWFIENFPNSAEIMKTSPNYQDRFK